MSLLTFSTGMWVITSALSSYSETSSTNDILVGFIFVFGVFVMTSLLHFTFLFPYRLLNIDKLHIFLLYTPAVLFSWIAIFTNTIVHSYTGAPTDVGVITGGPLYGLYNNFLLLLFLSSLSIMLFRMPRLDGIHKKNTKLLFWAILLGGIFPVVIDLILPTYFSNIQINSLVGNISTGIWLGATTYIVLKR